MNELFYVLATTVSGFISVLLLFLMGRAVLGLFADEESKAFVFCYAVTEPVVSPVRNLLSRIPSLEDFPIDLSYMATCLILIFIKLALPYS